MYGTPGTLCTGLQALPPLSPPPPTNMSIEQQFLLPVPRSLLLRFQSSFLFGYMGQITTRNCAFICCPLTRSCAFVLVPVFPSTRLQSPCFQEGIDYTPCFSLPSYSLGGALCRSMSPNFNVQNINVLHINGSLLQP